MTPREHKARPGTRPSPRGDAARVVAQWLKRGAFPDRLLDPAQVSRGFVMEVVYGVVRRWRTLAALRAKLAPVRPRAELDAFLLAGLYELLFMNQPQAYAAVNETVEAAKAVLGQRAANLVNAVLRRAAAERAVLEDAVRSAPPAIRLSHPDILWVRWARAFGEERATRLCEWNNTTPDLVLRVNLARSPLERAREALREAGVAAEPHPAAADRCLVLPHGVRIADLPHYDDGWFAVQDPSTLVAPDLLAPRAGERVLDACAAPGGKTMVLAEHMRGRKSLVAMDSSDGRLRMVRENATRLGWPGILTLRGEADQPEALRSLCSRLGLPPRFHAILLDVPCTNTGVLRRRPDARWRFTAARLAAACRLQRAILDGAAALLESGGRIVYSTCSLEAEENGRQVEAWLADHPRFRLEAERSLFPPEAGTDGMYAALLVDHG